MIQLMLAKVITALATKFAEFIGRWFLDWIGDIKDAKEIDKALGDEDRQSGARRLNDVFRN